MRAAFATLAVLYAVTCCARTSIPATASGYSYVDVSGIDITGYVFPMRDARDDGTEMVMRAEDAACVAEATCQRDVWITGNSQPDSSLYTPAPSNVIQSNLIFAAESFYANKGRSIKGRMSINSNDILRRFIDPEWVCGAQSVVAIDTGYVDYSYGLNMASGQSYEWVTAALNETLAPSSTVVEVDFDGRLTLSDMTKLYKNIKETKRVFGGVVDSWTSSSTWDCRIVAYVCADSFTRWNYGSAQDASTGWHSRLYSETYANMWTFDAYCWVQASGGGTDGGRKSDYSWVVNSGSRVVTRPELRGLVESATMYLGICGRRDTLFVYHESVHDYRASGDILLAYVKVPLTKSGTVSLGGSTCDAWSMPQGMDSSKPILHDLIFNVWGTSSSGFPLISIAYAYGGLLDLVMKPDVEIDDETWNP